MNTALVLGFSDYQQQAEGLAEAAGLKCNIIDIHHFPDGESKLTLPVELPSEVILCRTLSQPHEKLVELLLCAEAARQAGVQRITLVAPYLCYMRQDYAFHPGEVVSQGIIGRFLGGLFDKVITVDPHLHRISRLDEAVQPAEAISLSCTELMRDFIQQQYQQPLLVGPDEESEQWVRRIAEAADMDFVVARKERLGDRSVQIRLPEHDYHRHEVILVDDMISTGRTLMSISSLLQERGAESLSCLVSHALCGAEVLDQLHKAGFSRVLSSDSIPGPSNAIALAPLLATAL